MKGRHPYDAKRTPLQVTLPPRKLSGLGPLLSRGNWVRRWNHVVRGGRVVKATSTPTPNTNPEPVTESPKQAEVTTTRKTAKSKKLQPKPTSAPKPPTVKTKTQAAASVKIMADKPNPAKLVVHHILPLPHSRVSLTSSTTFPLKHVWR